MTIRHTSAILALSLGVFGLASTLSAHAADALGKSSWSLLSPKGGADLTHASGSVLHVVVHKATSPYYQLQLTHDIAAAVPAGKSLRYQFWARSATKNPIHAVIEKRTAPYTHYFDKTITLTLAWKQYAFTTPIPTAYGSGGLAARLQLGQQAGAVEFKNMTISTSP